MQTRNFDLLKPYITKNILILSSKYLDEFENNVLNAINNSNEIVLNLLIDNLNDSEKINLVFDNVKKISPNVDNILENLANTLGDNSGLTSLSTNFLELFFDQKKDTYSTLIAKNTFVKQNSANAIIKMSSIFILCYLAKNKINSSNIINHFEKKEIEKTVNTNPFTLKKETVEQPKKVNQTLAKKDSKENNSEKIVNKTDKELEIKPKNKKTVFIVIGLLAAISLAGFLYINSNNESNSNTSIQNNSTSTIDKETQIQPIEGEIVTNLGDFIDFTLPSDEIITIPEKGIEKALLDLVLDKSKTLDESSFWLCLDRIRFDARDINYKLESDEQIKNLSLIMSSFPKLEIVIGCYTDNLGNAQSNIELSKKRAESLKSGLISLGISENRITTEGFGDGFPIAENNSPESQKINRRISIKIFKK
jgi:OmpA-OmpF porin, OOP family